MSTVLLIHGFASNADLSWKRSGWIDVLADTGATIIAPDLLGHGDSPKPHDGAAYDDGVEEGILGALDGVDEPVDAVGFSMGGRALLVLAGLHPERFRRLVVGGIGANLFAGTLDRVHHLLTVVRPNRQEYVEARCDPRL